MSPTRRQLLLSSLAFGTVGLSARAGGATSSGPRNLVVMFADGGWDTSFSIDPKERSSDQTEGPWVDLGAGDDPDEEYQTEIRGIPLQLNDRKRLSVTKFFQEWGSGVCVVNGIWTGSIVHQPSRIRVLTGTQSPTSADFATLVGVERGVSEDLPLASVDFSGLGYTGRFAAKTGRIGHSAQLKALLDPNTTFPAPPAAGYQYPVFSPRKSEEAAIQEYLGSRVEAMRDRLGAQPHNDQLLSDMLEAYARRGRLLDEADVLTRPLSLGNKPNLALQADLAAALLQSRLCHTVILGEDGPIWDTHDGNHLQHDRHQQFFSAANRLLQGLKDANLLDSTLVVFMSEMTRTPRRNFKGGKDHWAHTSFILAGARVAGGRVVGHSNERLESLRVDFSTGDPRSEAQGGRYNKYDNMAAGLLAHMDVDPAAYLPGVEPFTLFSAAG